jgi:hypothetical protein
MLLKWVVQRSVKRCCAVLGEVAGGMRTDGNSGVDVATAGVGDHVDEHLGVM